MSRFRRSSWRGANITRQEYLDYFHSNNFNRKSRYLLCHDIIIRVANENALICNAVSDSIFHWTRHRCSSRFIPRHTHLDIHTHCHFLNNDNLFDHNESIPVFSILFADTIEQIRYPAQSFVIYILRYLSGIFASFRPNARCYLSLFHVALSLTVLSWIGFHLSLSRNDDSWNSNYHLDALYNLFKLISFRLVQSTWYPFHSDYRRFKRFPFWMTTTSVTLNCNNFNVMLTSPSKKKRHKLGKTGQNLSLAIEK